MIINEIKVLSSIGFNMIKFLLKETAKSTVDFAKMISDDLVFSEKSFYDDKTSFFGHMIGGNRKFPGMNDGSDIKRPVEYTKDNYDHDKYIEASKKRHEELYYPLDK